MNLAKYMISSEDEVKDEKDVDSSKSYDDYDDKLHISISENIDILCSIIAHDHAIAKHISNIWEMANNKNNLVFYDNYMSIDNKHEHHYVFKIYDIDRDIPYEMKYRVHDTDCVYNTIDMHMKTPGLSYDYTDKKTIRVFVMLFFCAVMRNTTIRVDTDFYKDHLDKLSPFICLLDEIVERFGEK